MKIFTTIKNLAFVSKVFGWFNVPYTKIITPILNGIYSVGSAYLSYVIKKNQRKSDEIIKQQEQTQTTIETEVTKPLPQQNNDVLRDALRNQHRK